MPLNEVAREGKDDSNEWRWSRMNRRMMQLRLQLLLHGCIISVSAASLLFFSFSFLALSVQFSKNNCVKTNKDRHILSAALICGSDSIVSGNIRFVRIFGRVL